MSHNAIRFNARPAHRLVHGSGQLAHIRFDYNVRTGAITKEPDIAFPFTNCTASVVNPETGLRINIYGRKEIPVRKHSTCRTGPLC